MSNTKHTPGPWSLNMRDMMIHAEAVTVEDGFGSAIAGVHVWPESPRWKGTPEEASAAAREVNANARLIAASPRLLQATTALLHLARCMAAGPGWTQELFDDVTGFAQGVLADVEGES